jgi:hypothetical protein
MYPFSYTSLKIVHEQKIQEALEKKRPDAGQKTRRRTPRQAFALLLARLSNRPDQKQEPVLPACVCADSAC